MFVRYLKTQQMQIRQNKFFYKITAKRKQQMNTQGIPYLKREILQMEQTNEQSDDLIKNPELVEDNFQKMRENLQWKITLNAQIEFLGKYVLYELLQTHKYYDLYRGIKVQNRQRVIIKIIDKAVIKLGLIENQFLHNWQQQYEEFLQKIQIEHQASVALVNSTTYIFLVKSQELYGNSDCIIKVTQNYYDQPLSKILLRRGSLTIQQALAVTKQIIYALAQYHKQNIILTELNPQFIVYKNGVFKISDLSSMRKVGRSFTSTLNLYNSYSYEQLVAPQLKVCPQIVDIKSQIWAIGVLFYHMIAHSIPYEERGLNIVKKARSHNITVQTRFGSASQQILDFLRNLLQINPDERITWNKLLNNPLFDKKQYFGTIKMLPLVDVRCQTIKKRQQNIIQQENICNGFVNSLNKIIVPTNKIKQIKEKVMFKIVRQDKKIDIKKCLDVEIQAFFFIQQTNLLALKAVYFYQQILTKIKKYDLIDKNRRSHFETVFLIAERCYQNVMKSKDYQRKSSDRRMDNYLQQIKKPFEEIKAFFIWARQQYESIDKSTYYISNDIFSMLRNNSKQKERSKMLRGKQGRDFTLQQNVRFTQQKCINKILPEMKVNGNKKQQHNALEYVKINLMNYEKINSITLNDMKTQHCFSDVVAKVISYNKNSS